MSAPQYRFHPISQIQIQMKIQKKLKHSRMSDTVVQIQYWFHQEHFYHRAQTVNILQLGLVGFWNKFDSGSRKQKYHPLLFSANFPELKSSFRQFSAFWTYERRLLLTNWRLKVSTTKIATISLIWPRHKFCRIKPMEFASLPAASGLVKLTRIHHTLNNMVLLVWIAVWNRIQMYLLLSILLHNLILVK